MKSGIVLTEGLVNAQFTSDAKTIKARKRMAMLISSRSNRFLALYKRYYCIDNVTISTSIV
jgi:hypothetical protein